MESNSQGIHIIYVVDYFKAELRVAVYLQNIDSVWQERTLAYGLMSDFEIDDKGNVLFRNQKLQDLLAKARTDHARDIETEKIRRAQEQLRRYLMCVASRRLQKSKK